MERKKVNLALLNQKKISGEKITMLTAYDAPTARALDEAGIDTILVGDSAANVVMGYDDTIPISMEEMLMLTAAVVRGTTWAYVIGDMPFMSYNINHEQAIRNAGRFMKEAGAKAIKLEGGAHVADTLAAIVKAGIPSVGHLGLTPQTAQMIGGYRVQGRTAVQASQIVTDAIRLQEAGACMLVMECVPDRLGSLVSRKLEIPVIGIGAGSGCDGQVLVLHDMLGIRAGFTPKFVKSWADIGERMTQAARDYRKEVEAIEFPASPHCFDMEDKEYEKLLDLID